MGEESGTEEDSDSSTDDEHTWTHEVKKKHRCARSKSKIMITQSEGENRCKVEIRECDNNLDRWSY